MQVVAPPQPVNTVSCANSVTSDLRPGRVPMRKRSHTQRRMRNGRIHLPGNTIIALRKMTLPHVVIYLRAAFFA